MKIEFYNEDASYTLPKQKVRFWVMSLADQEQKTVGGISVIFCSDEYLAKLNSQYLDATYLTDVITFDYTEGDSISGDIFISVERVKGNAKMYKQTESQEMLRVIFHGVLHLCGYKDKTEAEKKQMREKEDYYLQKLGIND